MCSVGQNATLPSFTFCPYEPKWNVISTSRDNLTFAEYLNQTMDLKNMILKANFIFGSEAEYTV